MPNLIVLTGLRRGTVHPVGDGLVIGRSGQAQLRLPDFLVSTRHAEIVGGGQRAWQIRDLGSTNGTFRNGARVSEPTPLDLGDLLHLGSTELLFTDRERLDEPGPGVVHASLVAHEEQGDGPGEVRLLADDDEEVLVEGPDAAGITMVLPVVHVVERSFSQATDLDALLERVAGHFARSVGGSGVAVALRREAGFELVYRGVVSDRLVHREAELPFAVREELLERASRARGALLARVEPARRGEPAAQPQPMAAAARSGARAGAEDEQRLALCVPLPSATGVVGVVYVHAVRPDLTKQDLRVLSLVASLAGVHCRNHLLLAELRDRNTRLEATNLELERARAQLADWNRELEGAVRRRTAELERSERSYRELFEESRDGNFTLDREGRFATVNRTAARALGLPPEELRGRPVAETLGSTAGAALLGADRAALVGGFAGWLDAQAISPAADLREVPLEVGGRRAFVEVQVRPILGADGRPEGLHGVVRDVTSRHWAEERMRLLTRIVDNVREAVVSTTLDGVVTSWNSGAERLYGYTADEVLAELLPTVPDKRGTEFERVLKAVAEGRNLALRTERAARDDRQIPVLATFAPVPDNEGAVVGLVEIARDLTEQLRLEDRMRFRERMASFGELTVGLAHELGNPLANLRSGVEFLLARPRPAEEAREALEVLHQEIERLQRLVQQALDLGRWKLPVPAPLDADELLDFIAATVRPLAVGQRVEVVRGPRAGVTVAGDLDQLKQALLNLVSNAVEAMPDGGRLELSAARDGDEGLLSVTDDGVGITPEDAARAFDLFFSRKKDGSGIGLAIVKRIVDLHEGRVTLEGEPGQGTTARIWLPLSPAAPEAGR